MVAAVGVEAWKERYCWRRRKEFGWTCRCGIALGSVVAHSLVLSANARNNEVMVRKKAIFGAGFQTKQSKHEF